MKKKLPSNTDSGMIAIISIRPKIKSLLRKEIYGGLKRKPESPRKWHHIKMKSAPSKSAWFPTNII